MMYRQQQEFYHSSPVDATTRVFSPIILFHDATTAEQCSDNQVIELKKQEVDAMLKTNVQFWSNVIQNTRRQDYSPPETPPPTAAHLYPTSPVSTCSSSKCPDEDVDELEDSLEEEDDSEHEEQQQRKHKSAPKTKTNNGRKRRGNLPKNVTAILKQWLIDNSRHPYPTEEEKRDLRLKTNLTLNQISNWFINARRRILPLILSSPTNNIGELDKKKQSQKKKQRWYIGEKSAVKTLSDQH